MTTEKKVYLALTKQEELNYLKTLLKAVTKDKSPALVNTYMSRTEMDAVDQYVANINKRIERLQSEVYSLFTPTYKVACNWKRVDTGSMGVPDNNYQTECKRSVHESIDTIMDNFQYCPFCGNPINNC